MIAMIPSERPPVRQQIFIEDTLAATLLRPPSWQNSEGGWQTARSGAYVCPRCLRIWAVLPIEGDLTYAIYSELCPAHEGGSLFPWWGVNRIHDLPLLEALPRALLEREFRINLAKMEKQDAR